MFLVSAAGYWHRKKLLGTIWKEKGVQYAVFGGVGGERTAGKHLLARNVQTHDLKVSIQGRRATWQTNAGV